MMGLDTPETCRGWRNILRISCASSWFFFTRLYRDTLSTKQKKILTYVCVSIRTYVCMCVCMYVRTYAEAYNAYALLEISTTS